jgi:hypothetical protein
VPKSHFFIMVPHKTMRSILLGHPLV